MIVSCIMLGRQGVVEKAHAINLETMQPEPAAAANHQAAQAAMSVPLLGLSEQQQEFIAVGMRLHADLLLGIHSERQKLQLQLASNSSDEGSSDSRGSSSGSVSSISSGQLDSLSLRHQELQQQQAQTDRLNLLLHKVGYTGSIFGVDNIMPENTLEPFIHRHLPRAYSSPGAHARAIALRWMHPHCSTCKVMQDSMATYDAACMTSMLSLDICVLRYVLIPASDVPAGIHAQDGGHGVVCGLPHLCAAFQAGRAVMALPHARALPGQ